MDIDPGTRQPDRDTAPDIMDTFIDAKSTTNTQHDDADQPERTLKPTTAEDQYVPPVPGESKDRDHLTKAQEQSAPKPPKPPKPHFTQDLLSLCGLQPLVATIARVDPVTGEKINKLRKSYEGHLKPLGLAGKNKGVQAEPDKRLLETWFWPEEEYYSQKVHGKDVRSGLPAATLAKLEKAMHMQPGPLPDNSKWEEIFGFEKAKPMGTTFDKKGKAGTSATQTSEQVNGHRTAAAAGAESEDTRPKRAGKKRRYNDDSFEGYAEGFVDDAEDVVGGEGYSSEERSRRESASKRRKKSSKDFSANSPTINDRGMIGVGSYAR